jgi:hypothetical protein
MGNLDAGLIDRYVDVIAWDEGKTFFSLYHGEGFMRNERAALEVVQSVFNPYHSQKINLEQGILRHNYSPLDMLENRRMFHQAVLENPDYFNDKYAQWDRSANWNLYIYLGGFVVSGALIPISLPLAGVGVAVGICSYVRRNMQDFKASVFRFLGENATQL